MPTKPRNAVPALKDKVINKAFTLNAIPSGANGVLFVDPFYDYEIKSIVAYVIVVTQAAAAPFTLGFGSYVDVHGNLISGNPTFYLPASVCLDTNGQTFSTQILPAGTAHPMAVPLDPTGVGTRNLPRNAPLTLAISGSAASNNGQVILNVILRPKELDRGDSSKRPWGAADDSYATYLK